MQKIKKICSAYENETCVLKLQRDVIRIAGPDAGKYLQGQLTQDVLGMKEGESVWSFLLNPDGKVNAWLRVSQISENQYLLDVDSDSGEAVIERLLRFKLRTECELTLEKWKGKNNLKIKIFEGWIPENKIDDEDVKISFLVFIFFEPVFLMSRNLIDEVLWNNTITSCFSGH